MTFAALFRRHRIAAGLTQYGLAKASGINVGTVNRLERGQRSPSGPAQVRALAAALGLSGLERDELLHAGGFPCGRCGCEIRRRVATRDRWGRWKYGSVL